MGDLLDEIGATGACGEQPMEQTAGQRIAAAYCDGLLAKEIAGKIDEAIREAREEERNKMCAGLSRAGIDYTYEWPSFDKTFAHFNVHSPQWKEWKEQLAAKEADCAAMRLALEPFAGRFTDYEGLQDEWDSHRRTYIGDYRMADAALASNAGTDLLARLRAAEQREIALAAALRKIAGGNHLSAPWQSDGYRKKLAEDALDALQAARAKEGS